MPWVIDPGLMVMQKTRFIVLLADGARYDIFAELLQQGQLPHIEETFLQEGTFAKAASAFPSTTGPAYMPFLTGCCPGSCNVPGIRWFDKEVFGKKKLSLGRFRSYVGIESFLMNDDMKKNLVTLFEHFPKSFNIFSSVNRGVPSQGNLTAHMRMWYWYYAHLTDRWHMVDEVAVDKCRSVIQKDFQFLFAIFPGIDEYTHLSHCRHREALQAYKNMDRAVGQIAQELKQQGKYEETALFIVSDHGLSQTHTHFGVAGFLESKGIKTFYYPKIFKWGFEAASMVSGNGMLNLYLKGTRGWTGRMPLEEIRSQYSSILEELRDQPAVDLIAAQDHQGWVHLLAKNGEVKILEKDGRLKFINIQGDPLELQQPEGEFSHQEGLLHTIDTSYPDSLFQLTQLFRSPRTGDLVLSAAKGYDLRKRFEHPEHKSSHGALHEEHMLIPLFSNVAMKRDKVRSADLFPSILQLHGDSIPAGLDGDSFFS